LSTRLVDLCQAGFLEEKLSWNKKHGEYYKVIDEFTLFQLRWIASRKGKHFPNDYWITISQSQSYRAWAGYAFESLCMKHVDQIIKAAKIKSANIIDSWRFIPRKHLETGAQIDLLIDRNDDAITICEIKYTEEPFVIDKQYAKNLQNKIHVFQTITKTKKHIFLILISANGIKPTMYSEELISGVVTLDDLFAD
jgi:uncharacterized protein